MSALTLPASVRDKLADLEKLIEEYPEHIPTAAAAKFLGINVEFLKSAIAHGNFEWALYCQKDKRGYRAFKIFSTPFYLWYSRARGV